MNLANKRQYFRNIFRRIKIFTCSYSLLKTIKYRVKRKIFEVFLSLRDLYITSSEGYYVTDITIHAADLKTKVWLDVSKKFI